MTSNADELDTNRRDVLVAASRGAAGMIPVFGGPLGELISGIIPRQRLDRITIYLRELERRLSEMESNFVEGALAQPEKADFVEVGAYQAARAISPDRIVRIVAAVTNGIKGSEAESIRRMRLLKLLGELDDDELAILSAFGKTYGGSGQNPWESIERPEPEYFGAEAELHDKNALYDLGEENLLRLGLLRKGFPGLKRGQLPEFDASAGNFKGSLQISYLGRMLLREIGLPAEIDAEDEDSH